LIKWEAGRSIEKHRDGSSASPKNHFEMPQKEAREPSPCSPKKKQENRPPAPPLLSPLLSLVIN